MAIKISFKFYIARAQLRLDRGEKKEEKWTGQYWVNLLCFYHDLDYELIC
jgi:hypothetical protein